MDCQKEQRRQSFENCRAHRAAQHVQSKQTLTMLEKTRNILSSLIIGLIKAQRQPDTGKKALKNIRKTANLIKQAQF